MQVNTKATGIGGIIANKGGITAKFDYRGDSICIVTPQPESRREPPRAAESRLSPRAAPPPLCPPLLLIVTRQR